MTQKQVDLNKALSEKKHMYTQTGEIDDFFIRLNGRKTARIYYSSSYKEKVLSLNFGTSKNFIFTKSMWDLFRNYTNTIDNILKND